MHEWPDLSGDASFLETLCFFPKGSFKNFLLGHLPKKACKESAPTYNRRPNAGSHLLVSQGGIWSTKMWHWAVSCTQTCTHLWMAHTLCTHKHMCVCSDSLNNNVLLPYWSSGYFSNIFNDVVLHFQRKSFTFKNKRCSSEFFPADQNHFDVTQAHFSRWCSLPLEKDDNGLAEFD